MSTPSRPTAEVVAVALRCELGYSAGADAEVPRLFDRLHRVLAPQLSALQFDLMVADLKGELEDRLAAYIEFDAQRANYVAEAVAEALMRPRARPSKQKKS
jgi:hypothetical protein